MVVVKQFGSENAFEIGNNKFFFRSFWRRRDRRGKNGDAVYLNLLPVWQTPSMQKPLVTVPLTETGQPEPLGWLRVLTQRRAKFPVVMDLSGFL
jgi:hypothetical protein